MGIQRPATGSKSADERAEIDRKFTLDVLARREAVNR
jgi:hypothetical protein